MIKTLNHYSGLISVVVLIVGFFVTIQTFAFGIEDKIEDITADYAQYKKWSKDDRVNTKKATIDLINDNIDGTNKIITSLNGQAIHQGYLKDAVKEHTEATVELSKSIMKLNIFLERVKSQGYFEMSKNEPIPENGGS